MVENPNLNDVEKASSAPPQLFSPETELTPGSSRTDEAPHVMIDLVKEIDMAIPEAPDIPFASDTPSAKVDLLKEIGMAASEALDIPPASGPPSADVDPLKEIGMAIPETPDVPSASDTPSADVDLLKEIGMAASEALNIPPASDAPRADVDPLKEIGIAVPEALDIPPASDTPRADADLLKGVDISASEALDIPFASDAPCSDVDLLEEIEIAASEALDIPPVSDTPRENVDLMKGVDMAAHEAPDVTSASDMLCSNVDLLKEISMAVLEKSDVPPASDMSRMKADLFKEIDKVVPKASDVPPAPDISRMKADLFKETDMAASKAFDAPFASDSSQTMADLLKEIDKVVPDAPDAPPAALPKEKEDVSASVSLPPKLSKPKDQGSPPRQDEPVKETLSQKPADGSEALAPALENIFETQSPEDLAAPSPLEEKQLDSMFSEPEQRAATKKALTVPPHPMRPLYVKLRFLFILFLWILLLAAATLFFGTNYFERWFSGDEPRQSENVFLGQPVTKAAFEIRDLKWFSENMSGDKKILAVTGTVTNRGNPVPWVQVRAAVTGKDNDVLMEKSVVAGNQLDNIVLKTMSQEQVEAHLSKRNENGAADHEAPTGLALPFMAVFFDPPDMVHAVTVKATAGEDK